MLFNQPDTGGTGYAADQKARDPQPYPRLRARLRVLEITHEFTLYFGQVVSAPAIVLHARIRAFTALFTEAIKIVQPSGDDGAGHRFAPGAAHGLPDAVDQYRVLTALGDRQAAVKAVCGTAA